MVINPRECSSWSNAIENHSQEAQKLLENALEQTNLVYPVKWLLSAGYKLSGGHYLEEISAWAEAIGASDTDVVLGNLSYELFQTGQYLVEKFPGIIGCTSVVTEVPKLGLVHVRNLDWDLEGMGQTTILLHLDTEDREIVAVTNPGFVGVLSGMVPGKFSITLNWAPPSEAPWFDFGPVFLTRWVLEHASDFDEAVAYLSDTILSSPALFTVCGINNACVIERTRKEHTVRYYDGKTPLVVTNHYVTQEFEDRNDDDILEDSEDRYQSAMKAAKRFKGNALERTLKILSGKTCLNELTVQQMAFAPAKNQYCALAFNI